jgi:hypothetical protein
MNLSEIPLATCSFKEFEAEMGVPVQTSVGNARYIKFAVEQGKSMAPYGLLKVGDPVEFERRYRDRLNSHTNAIMANLTSLATSYPGQRLVLLCFEDLRQAWCHRIFLARWLEALGAQPIPELGHQPPGPKPEQESLL